MQTVNCLDMYELFDRIISGSADKTCKGVIGIYRNFKRNIDLTDLIFVKVWNMGKKKCWRTFKHSYAVTAVGIGEEICITGGATGKIKVFHLLSGHLIKVRGRK